MAVSLALLTCANPFQLVSCANPVSMQRVTIARESPVDDAQRCRRRWWACVLASILLARVRRGHWNRGGGGMKVLRLTDDQVSEVCQKCVPARERTHACAHMPIRRYGHADARTHTMHTQHMSHTSWKRKRIGREHPHNDLPPSPIGTTDCTGN